MHGLELGMSTFQTALELCVYITSFGEHKYTGVFQVYLLSLPDVTLNQTEYYFLCFDAEEF